MNQPAYNDSLDLDADSSEDTQPVLCPPTKAERLSALGDAVTPVALAPITVPAREVGWWLRAWLRVAAFLRMRQYVAIEKSPAADPEVAWAERRVLAAAELVTDAGYRYERMPTAAMKRAFWSACIEQEFAVNALKSARRVVS